MFSPIVIFLIPMLAPFSSTQSVRFRKNQGLPDLTFRALRSLESSHSNGDGTLGNYGDVHRALTERDTERKSKATLAHELGYDFDIYDEGDTNYPFIAARSSNSPARKQAEIVESGRSFGFSEKQGVGILTKVGQILSKNQYDAMPDIRNSDKAWRKQNQMVRKGINEQFEAGKAGNVVDWMIAERNIQESWARRERWIAKEAEQRKTQTQQGKDIEHISMVNKEMRKRMKTHFRPVSNIYLPYQRKVAAASRIEAAARTTAAKRLLRAKKRGKATRSGTVARTTRVKSEPMQRKEPKKTEAAKKGVAAAVEALVRTKSAKNSFTTKKVATAFAAVAANGKTSTAKKTMGIHTDATKRVDGPEAAKTEEDQRRARESRERGKGKWSAYLPRLYSKTRAKR